MLQNNDLSNAAQLPQPMDGPIPGQSLTTEPRKFPYERPPEYTDIDDILDFLFRRLSTEKVAMRALAAMEMGVPIKMIVENIITTGASEGFFPIHAGYVAAPALSVMLIRMAEKADITPRLTPNDEKKGKLPSEVLGAMRRNSREASIKARSAAEVAAKGRKDVKPDGFMKSDKMGLSVPIGGLGSKI